MITILKIRKVTLIMMTTIACSCSSRSSAFTIPHTNNNNNNNNILPNRKTLHKPTELYSSTQRQSPTVIQKRAKKREGPAQIVLNLILASPLWKILLVPQARANIVKTAEANGINWNDAKKWFLSNPGPWNTDDNTNTNTNYDTDDYPEYYTKEFHAYSHGNLCWDAAIEQELASRAVGARNFPSFGRNGEDAFRSAFDDALSRQGADVVTTNGGGGGSVVVDMGCGTGTSSRRILDGYGDRVEKVIGIDLSPYMITVGNALLDLRPNGPDEHEEDGREAGGGRWVTTISPPSPRSKLHLRTGNIERTDVPPSSVSVVNLSLVLHELPIENAKNVLREAHRMLVYGGQVWISEMDFEAPAYAKQRENALLFSLLRSTEPFLDEYAEGFGELLDFMVRGDGGGLFDKVCITAATGRHYALVATKGSGNNSDGEGGVMIDTRFKDDGSYRLDDTHLQVWESKE